MAAFYESVVRVLLRQTLFPPLKRRIKIRTLVYATRSIPGFRWFFGRMEKCLLRWVNVNAKENRWLGGSFLRIGEGEHGLQNTSAMKVECSRLLIDAFQQRNNMITDF